MIRTDKLSDPTVRAVVDAINSGDRDKYFNLLAPDAVMTDDGSERDLHQWADNEIFISHGHMEVESQSNNGHDLIARYSNDMWGEMRTKWHFEIAGDKLRRIDTGQA
ncbi:nuclear transport factor 2 family protein [Streptomyces pathocidini]|uniref:nuclear transport factor 2 family protein n=1 Tax=Streptomyces pathocidini TaxID=1650571 RepID=UPI00340F6917